MLQRLIGRQQMLLNHSLADVAAAIVHPGEERVGVPAEGRAGAEQGEGLVLAVPIGGNAVAAVENAGMDGILELEGRNDRTGGENVGFQTPSGHVVHAFGEFVAEFVEDVPVRPSRLEFPCGRLSSGYLRSRDRCCCSKAGHLQEPAARLLGFTRSLWRRRVVFLNSLPLTPLYCEGSRFIVLERCIS